MNDEKLYGFLVQMCMITCPYDYKHARALIASYLVISGTVTLVSSVLFGFLLSGSRTFQAALRSLFTYFAEIVSVGKLRCSMAEIKQEIH